MDFNQFLRIFLLVIFCEMCFSVNVEKSWWQTGAFYQIYPRSFKDSNGDGIGDLNGITEKLPYLKELGITATWLSPIFKSPMADFGYDISDFFNIQPEYGTLEDFDRMIAKANELNLKIILDFVPNHSSDENDWFHRSVNREKGYEDFYVWHPGFPDPEDSSNRLPPTNWISVFHGSAWEFNPVRKEFYLHQFAVKQPDLNYRNPLVVEIMKSVLLFWLNRGVAGFRIDAVPHLFEIAKNSEGNFQDEPISGFTNDTNDWNYLEHIYTKDQNETIDMIYQWRQLLDKFEEDSGGDTRVMLTESYSPIEIVMQYYGDGKREGAHLPFNFQLLEQINNGSSAFDYKASIHNWLGNMPKGRTPNWVMGNHDQNRIASRLGTDAIDFVNMILLTLPGASITYNGEEIGMIDQWISWEDTKDPAACNTNPDIYEQFSRDPERTPFQWDNSTSAGFSTSTNTWLPVASNYKIVNVYEESKSEKSHLKIFKDLIKLRNEQTLKYGDVLYKAINENILVIIRYLQNEPSYATVINLGNDEETVDLSYFNELPDLLEYFIVSINSDKFPGEQVEDNTEVPLKPRESFVVKSSPLDSKSRPKDYFVYLVVNENF